MRNLPIVTRYLLIANGAVFVLAWILNPILIKHGVGYLPYGTTPIDHFCGLHYVGAGTFHFWQPFTYMFLHANFWHLFFNMFAVWMFGPSIERELGTRRYIIFYLLCGLGAAIVQEAVWALMGYDPGVQPWLNTIGASGAVFGILFAFGWLFPNVPMFLLFIPIPIRARIFVLIYAGIELLSGIHSVTADSADNVAHFAHLGGFLFGWLIILYWKHINWREPQFGLFWEKCKGLFRRHKRLDSTKNSDFDNYHYQKRV